MLWRPGWAVLAAGALIASLLAVGASPAAAVKHRPDLTPEWSACVGAAGTHDSQFSDVDEDHTHAGNINCIAYYGITLGKGDGTYAPDEHVSAFQMGLFVQRAADLMGADGEDVLDSVELSDTVTRVEMAKLMFGLIDDIRDDVRINRDGVSQVDSDGDGVWEDVDDYFADAKAQVPIADSDLIGAAYELGVTRGRSANVSTADSVFEPSDPVTRAQMASFLTRAMDHSNLRPEGLAVQRNNNDETQVSYRDADFAPIEDAHIDVFSSLYPDDAFDEDDGECESRFTKDETPSFDACEIDIGDQLTDDDGNVDFTLDSDSDPITAACTAGGEFEFTTATGGSDDRTFWAWTGSLGDEVDEDTTLADLESVDRPVGGAPPDHAFVSGGLPTADEIAKMGETVTFTVQIRTAGGDPIGPDRSGNAYHVRIEKFFLEAAEEGDSGFPGYEHLAVPGIDAGTAFHTPFDSLMFPNSDGEFTINLTHGDTNAALPDPDVGVRFSLTPFSGNDLIDMNLLPDIQADANQASVNEDGVSAIGRSVFSDDAAKAKYVGGESTASYRIIRAGSTANSVTVTVTDQYGDGYRNAGITVRSTLDEETPADDNARYPEEVDITVQPGEGNDFVGTFDTRRDGTYRIGYNYTRSDPAVEEITPSVAAIPEDATTDPVIPAVEAIDGDAVTVYWASTGIAIESQPDDDGDATFVDVLVADVRSRAIVVDDRETGSDVVPKVYYYDEEDTFVVEGVGATFEMWEEALSDGNPVQVQWESYEFNRPRDRAVWELTLTCS